ncbi:MAG: enoyl-CoA hydratase-related protein, partial [bacterium]|nr:enoyl-CoA hydratase-related protein [bacterium]
MKFLKFEKRGQVGILSVHRPDALNALTSGVFKEMYQFLNETPQAEDIRVLILTGAGEKAFVAGADIKEMSLLNTAQMYQYLDLGQKVMNLLERIDLVTIAAVNGFALGGGLELALACDFIYASTKARLGLPEVTLGLVPGFGGMQRLARAVGTRKAKEMAFTGAFVKADEAQAIRLVNKVVEPDQLIDESLKTAAKILENGFFAVGNAKRSINCG